MFFLSTLINSSLEDFINFEEISVITNEIKELKSKISEKEINTLTSSQSVHSLEGYDARAGAAIYSPNGRIEIPNLINSKINIVLQSAFNKRLSDIRRILPLAQRLSPWIYIEYSQGQYITSHIDLPLNELEPEHSKLAGITVCLNDNFSGGEFYIETCGSSKLWEHERGVFSLKKEYTTDSESFKNLPKTRWLTKPRKGTCLIFGSQLIHGTVPIISGVACKLISFITI